MRRQACPIGMVMDMATRNGLLLVLLLELCGCALAEDAGRESPKEKPQSLRNAKPAPVIRIPPPPAPPRTEVPAVPAQRPIAPPPPAAVTNCDAGGCWSGGVRYQGGTGNTYLDRNGRVCQRSGNWMQCF